MFARVALDLPVTTEFTYSVPEKMAEELRLGQRVRVPFRTTTRVGYLVGLDESTDVGETRDLTAVVDAKPIVPADLLELARWISGYYCCSLGEALQAMLPGGVRRGRPKRRYVERIAGGEAPARVPKAALLLEALDGFKQPPTVKQLLESAHASRAALKTLERARLVRVVEKETEEEWDAPEEAVPDTPPVLEPPQAAALDAILGDLTQPAFAVHLLLGVTGSGKTEVYLRAIKECVEVGRQAIVLVPEIALTPQTVRRFRARFGQVAVLHSAQSERERRAAWQRIRNGDADVVIGPRSAVFAPLPRVGLIVVDEEHENSFKQEHTPRYHARDVAIVRAKAASCPVILGSATPSLESYANACRRRYVLHRLPKRAGGYPLPPVEIVDLANEPGRIFSQRMRNAVSDAVRAGGQVILFLNRRGFATVVACRRCGHVLGCPHCSTTLVFHKGRRSTACHLCGHEARVSIKCPECHAPALKFAGIGTERVAEEAARAWPGVSLVRIDSDTVRGDRLEAALDRFRSGEARILIGTQMIAKGHHFPSVTLVGIVNADTALHLADFRANERTFSLITQVAGRAGRGQKGGKVLVQTYNPRHYAIANATRHDFERFAAEELEERRLLGLPPGRRCALLVLSSERPSEVAVKARLVAESLRPLARDLKVELRGPAKAPIERVRGRWRWMILLLGRSGRGIGRLCREARKVKLSSRVDMIIDVDPSAVL